MRREAQSAAAAQADGSVKNGLNAGIAGIAATRKIESFVVDNGAGLGPYNIGSYGAPSAYGAMARL